MSDDMTEQDWRDLREERAAILQYEAGIEPRRRAEQMADAEIIRLRKAAKTGSSA